MHEYEQQWSRASGHAVRHPLKLKMERLQAWCEESPEAASFEARLQQAQSSDDLGECLLAEELKPLWHTAREGRRLPFPG